MVTAVKYKNKGISGLWEGLTESYSNVTAVIDTYSGLELTYKKMYQLIRYFASGLQSIGLKKGQHVSLFSENSSKWLVADQAVLMCGAVDAVRGSQSPAEELAYIFEHSDSVGLIAENLETIKKLRDLQLNFMVCLSNEYIDPSFKKKYKIYSFSDILQLGAQHEFVGTDIYCDDLATIVYTSGTTGKPKGVMLTHGSLMSQIISLDSMINVSAGKKSLNILPTWHIYERTGEYFFISKGITMVNTNIPNFKKDIKLYKPDYLVAVPRIWEAIHEGVQSELKKSPYIVKKLAEFFLKTGEIHIKSKRVVNGFSLEETENKLYALVKMYATLPFYSMGESLIYEKIRSALGDSFKLGVSGGGALAGYLEDFYEIIGVNIIVGYGMTESSPVLTIRSLEHNKRYTAGRALPKTEIKIQNGVVFARGPQVMKGYYKDIQATKDVLSEDGWLNTGDLGFIANDNDLVLTGRQKDVIVLSNGENIEPQPLEEVLLKSPYICQVMLVGQDKAHLGALIVPDSELAGYSDVNKILKKELKEQIEKRANFRQFERVQCFKVLDEPFSVENGLLTRTMKVKKNAVYEKYRQLVEEMYRH